MLKKIKGSFFLKILFSYVNLKQKFEILKHNKSLQNAININNRHYQLFSGRYIIYEENGEVKEYEGNTDDLVFEGEYLNGKRNGKGKEYKDEKLIFEGEYLNGKRNGKGKEYVDDYIGKFIFEGEYLNGNRNGKWKSYDYNGNLIFESEYKNNKRNGNFKLYADGKLTIDYEYLDNEIVKGKKYDLNGHLRDEIKENGFRKDFTGGKLEFEGEYLNGKKNGKGKQYFYYDKGEFLLESKYINGEINGRVKVYKKNGKMWLEGDYFKMKQFLYYDKGAIILEAEYLNGKENGKVKALYNRDKIMFEGNYLNGKPWNIKTYDENGDLLYNLENGKGKVRVIAKNSGNELIFCDLEMLNGVAHGKGKEYNIYGQLESEKEYLYGKLCGKFLFYENNKLIQITDIESTIGTQVNGYAKRFDENGNLKYEGEVFNNIRIKGKQYVKGKLEYEGEYSFGKKWNGKGYNENGNIIYELKNGNGKVKEYDDEDALIFDGEYLNGKRNGKFKQYNNEDALIFEGEYLNGKLNGKLIQYNSQGKIVNEGEFLNGELISKKEMDE